MKVCKFIAVVCCFVFAVSFLVVNAQQPGDDDVRGAFISSRPKTTDPNAPPRRHQRRKQTTTTTGANASASVTTTKPTNTYKPKVEPSKVAVGPIGLGYTLFMRDEFGKPMRVDPVHEFRNGDRVRLSLEPNIDGYLYIFDSEDGGPPQMIFPDARLDSGYNDVDAHIPVEIPSNDQADERLRWFQFYGKPGQDRLYIVLTREPLPGVPSGETLVSYCAANKDKCPWRPPAEVWAQIQLGTKADVHVVTSGQFGQPQSNAEAVATTRGLGLDQNAPQPSVIRMSVSTSAPVLVTALDLIHR
jgi:hypothetical protein